MKKIMLFAAACVALAACSKEIDNTTPEIGNGTAFEKGQKVTLTVRTGDQTKVSSELVTSGTDKDNVNFAWETGDKIKVTVGTESAEFTLSSGAGTASATFTGTMPAAGETFDVQYPVDDPDLSSQTYVANGLPKDKMKMAATGCTLDTPFTLTPQYATLRLNLWGSKTVGKIVVIKINTTDPSFTLDCGTGVTTGTTKADSTAFFIVVTEGSYKFSAEIFDNAATPASICKFETTNAQTFIAGQSVNMPAKKVKPAIPDGALPGVFSVSATKKVRFSKGNLQATCTKAGAEGTSEYSWGFAEHQYDTLGRTSGNVTIANQTLGAKVDLFGWVGNSGTLAGNATKYGIAVSNKDNYETDYGNALGENLKADWGTVIDNDGTWQSLTIDEVAYLFSFNNPGGEAKPDRSNLVRQGLYVDHVTVVGHKNCIVLYPDGFTGTKASVGDETSYDTPEKWAAAEAAGVVCLPAAGKRGLGQTKIEKVDEKPFYWTKESPASGNNNVDAYAFGFFAECYNATRRLTNCSVRLVTEVK